MLFQRWRLASLYWSGATTAAIRPPSSNARVAKLPEPRSIPFTSLNTTPNGTVRQVESYFCVATSICPHADVIQQESGSRGEGLRLVGELQPVIVAIVAVEVHVRLDAVRIRPPFRKPRRGIDVLLGSELRKGPEARLSETDRRLLMTGLADGDNFGVRDG